MAQNSRFKISHLVGVLLAAIALVGTVIWLVAVWVWISIWQQPPLP